MLSRFFSKNNLEDWESMSEVMIRDDIVFEADGLNQCFDLTSWISCLGLVNPLPIHDLKCDIAEFFVSVQMHGKVSVLKHVDICR